MEKIYLIETKCNHTLRWRCEVVQHKSEYGNGKYVIIVNLDTHELVAYVDARYYVQFNFTEFIHDYIKQYFGQNLKTFYEED